MFCENNFCRFKYKFFDVSYFNRRNFRERNFREFREWRSHSRKFISLIFSKTFPNFFFYENKNNGGKRCFLYKNKVYKNRRKEKVVNIVKNRNFFLRNFFPNGHSRKFISQNNSKMAIRESLSREIAKIQVETSRKFISRKFLSRKFLRLK